ncbi:MAG: hypothetical protein ABIQ88_16845 [Chitinophagaceae bacterium]
MVKLPTRVPFTCRPAPARKAKLVIWILYLSWTNYHPIPEDFAKLSVKHDIHFRFDLLGEIMQKYKVKL